MQVTLTQVGELIYTVPAALVVLGSREWVRNGILTRLHREDPQEFPVYIEPLALGTLIVTQSCWGGLNQRYRRDNWLSFLLSQGWLYVLFALSLVYFDVKDLEKETYLYSFIGYVAIMSWATALVNWLPLPPFDASFFYFQPFVNRAVSQGLSVITRISGFVVLALLMPNSSWLRGEQMLQFVGLEAP